MSKLFLATLALLIALAGMPDAARAQAQDGNLTGTLQQVSSSQLTLQTAGHAVVLTLTPGTLIRLDGNIVMATDLKPGMGALVFAADGATATEIRAYSAHLPAATTPAAPAALSGQITQVGPTQFTLQTTYHALTISLTAATVVKVDGKIVPGIADLKTGIAALVFAADGQTASEVRAYSPPAPPTAAPASQPAGSGQTGILTAIGDGKLTLLASVHTLEFTLTDATVCKLDGKTVAASDLKPGLSAIVFATDGKVTEVRAYSPPAK